VVVGAGTAGSAAAWQLARRGLKVALVERRALADAGARWVVDVPAWMFERAGIALPEPPELRADEPPVALMGARPEHAVVFDPPPMLAVDGPRLVARLQRLALEAGVEAYPDSDVEEVECRGERPRALRLRRPAGELRLEASLFVDASGSAAALRRRIPWLDRRCPPLIGAELCTAVRQTFEVADRGAAEGWLEAMGAGELRALCWNGLGGGFSTRLVCLSPELDRVEVLHGGAHPERSDVGPRLQRGFLTAQRWIGRRISGGAAAIPVRRPWDTLSGPGVALLGDAACQVFPAHGSGVGAELVAARLLAEAVCGRADPGAGAATWAYHVAFARSIGAVHTAYDVFRRFSVTLEDAESDALLARGIVPPDIARNALEQRLLVPKLGDLASLARGAPRMPLLLPRAGRYLARIPAVWAACRSIPRTPGQRRIWAHAVAAAAGVRPDPS